MTVQLTANWRTPTVEDQHIWLRLMRQPKPRGTVANRMYGFATEESDRSWGDYYIMMSATRVRNELQKSVRDWQLGRFLTPLPKEL